MLRALMSPSAAPDSLAPAGLPLHTRTLELDVLQDGAGMLRADGVILDLRKCGFVPTGGELQTAGIIHQMSWRAQLREPSGEIVRLEISQPFVAMERSAATGGECCRDPAPRLQALVGSAFDAGFAKRLGAVFGGALGCSHLLTLGQALGAFVPRVLADAQRDSSERASGERVAKQTLTIDGFEGADGELALALQSAEYWLKARARAQSFLDRLRVARELRLFAAVGARDMGLVSLRGAARERTPETLASAPWRTLDAALAPLAGDSALRGMAARIRALADALQPADERTLLVQSLLNLAPALIQCLPALSHRFAGVFARAATTGLRDAAAAEPSALLNSGGMPDSCFMWRTGGPALRARTP
jgi:hypothetical protein